MPKIIIVEDDPAIAEMLVYHQQAVPEYHHVSVLSPSTGSF